MDAYILYPPIYMELSSHFQGASVNVVFVCNVNDPMPTGQGDIGTILLSCFEDGHIVTHYTSS